MSLKDPRWILLPIRIFLLITLLFCIFLATKRGIGAWRFQQGSPDSIQAAIQLDPGNPAYYDALGNLTHVYANADNSNEIVNLYENATRLSPHDARFWADLGNGYDWMGRSNDALDAFQRARGLFPNSPEVNWRLANFYVRAGKIPEALQSLHSVLLEDPTARRKVFTLATNATGDRESVLQMLPPQAPDFFGYLSFRIERGDIDGAEEVWARVLRLNLPFELADALPYFDALIQHRKLDQLSATWSALVQRFPRLIPRTVPSSNLLTNGGFESDILNGGFDWRIIPTEGAAVSLDSGDAFEGSRALRIAFQGSRNIDYAHVFQYVPVHVNTRYRFSARMRVQGITTDSGPRFQVCDAYNVAKLFISTDNLIGNSGWSEQAGEFTTAADTRMLLIRVIRPVSNKLDNQIGGTVWIDNVQMNPE